MAKTKRFTPRTRSTSAEIQENAPNMSQSASHRSPQSEPIGHIDLSINIEVQNSQETKVENQSSPENQAGDEALPTYRRKSNKYWTVNTIDGNEVITEEHLRVKDLFGRSGEKKMILDWNQEGQPIGKAAGLLGFFLGSIAANYEIFPINYDRWPSVPSDIKTSVWDKTIKKVFRLDEHRKKYIAENIGKKWKDTRVRLFAEFYDHTRSWEENLESRPDGIPRDQWAAFLSYRLREKTMNYSEKNIANRQKQTIPHTLGSKTIARKRRELDQLDIADGMSSGEDIYAKVFGKEHSGRVRGMGFGVFPSQYLSPNHCNGSSTMASSSGVTYSDYERLKLELEASNAKVQALEGEVAKVRTLEEQVAFLMQNFGGQFPNRFNNATDLSSPAEAKPSSSASHAPHTHGPSSTA